MDKHLHYQLLYRKLVSIEIPARCILTRKIVHPRNGKFDIHEGIVKKSAVNSRFLNSDQFSWMFGIENCMLLEHSAHIKWGQMSSFRIVHVFQKLRQGIQMYSWAKRSFLHGTTPEVLERILKEADTNELFMQKSELKGGWPIENIVWNREWPMWKYEHELTDNSFDGIDYLIGE